MSKFGFTEGQLRNCVFEGSFHGRAAKVFHGGAAGCSSLGAVGDFIEGQSMHMVSAYEQQNNHPPIPSSLLLKF